LVLAERSTKNTWTRRRFIKTAIWSGIGLLLIDTFWAEKFFVEINEYHLSEDKISGLKFVQISDLHLQSVGLKHKRLADKINSLKPDLVLLTGDSVDEAGNLDLLNKFLRLIDLKIPKAAILGNWEYWGKIDLERLRYIYEDSNCSLLINESKQFTSNGKTISITGLDDFVGGNADIDLAVKNYIPSDHHIILNHCPEYGDIISEKLHGKIAHDLILSGHTHGGQINLFGFVPFKPIGSGKYLKGWYKDEKKTMYVCRGIGTSIFPARFMARAEMAIFHL
jgi:predicted MPP superfamily phosphohydrolase